MLHSLLAASACSNTLSCPSLAPVVYWNYDSCADCSTSWTRTSQLVSGLPSRFELIISVALHCLVSYCQTGSLTAHCSVDLCSQFIRLACSTSILIFQWVCEQLLVLSWTKLSCLTAARTLGDCSSSWVFCSRPATHIYSLNFSYRTNRHDFGRLRHSTSYYVFSATFD